MSTRVGTECLGHMERAVMEVKPKHCILSVDGIGAYDHVTRSAMLGALCRLPRISDAAIRQVVVRASHR
eukprot:3414865-Karenia_brevis.AAC.1